MEWEFIAPMIVSIVLFLTIGGVLILRPLALRVSELLELYARDRTQGTDRELGQVRELLESMDARLQLMEERQDFTERLLAASAESSESRDPGTERGRPDDGGTTAQ